MRRWFIDALCQQLIEESEKYTPDEFEQRLVRLDGYLHCSPSIDSAAFWLEHAFERRVWWMVQEIARAGQVRQRA